MITLFKCVGCFVQSELDSINNKLRLSGQDLPEEGFWSNGRFETYHKYEQEKLVAAHAEYFRCYIKYDILKFDGWIKIELLNNAKVHLSCV